MKKKEVIWLVPGQGHQFVGCFSPWLNRFGLLKERFDWASDVLSAPLLKWSESEQAFQDTSCVQVLWTTFVYGLVDVFQKEGGKPPSALLGHSLGEVIGLSLAGAWTWEEGLKLIQKRGEAMKIQEGRGGLLVYLGRQKEEVLTFLDQVPEAYAANLNARDQLVFSGTRDSLERVQKTIQEKAWGKSQFLPVSVPAHSPLMKPAVEQWSKFLPQEEAYSLSIPVVSNGDAKLYEKHFPRERLLAQLTEGVNWVGCLERLEDHFQDPLYFEFNFRGILNRFVKSVVGREAVLFENFEEVLF